MVASTGNSLRSLASTDVRQAKRALEPEEDTLSIPPRTATEIRIEGALLSLDVATISIRLASAKKRLSIPCASPAYEPPWRPTAGNVRPGGNYLDRLKKDLQTAQVDHASSSFDQMKAAGYQPDIQAFNLMIATCAKGPAGEASAQQALDRFTEMTSTGISPSFVTCTALLVACERGGKIDEALERLAGIPPGPTNRAMIRRALILGCEKGAKAAPGKRDYGQMAIDYFHSAAPDADTDAETYCAVISACEQAGRLDEVQYFLEQGVRTGVFKPLLGYLRHKNELDLHSNAIFAATDENKHPKGVSCNMAQALLAYHFKRHHIVSRTQVIVGKSGESLIKQAALQFLARHGVQSIDHESNEGRIICTTALRAKPTTAPLTRRM